MLLTKIDAIRVTTKGDTTIARPISVAKVTVSGESITSLCCGLLYNTAIQQDMLKQWTVLEPAQEPRNGIIIL